PRVPTPARQLAENSELTLSCRGPWAGPAAVVGLWAHRPSPPPSAAIPPPTVAQRRASTRSPRRLPCQNMIWHDADIRRSYSSQRRPPIDGANAGAPLEHPAASAVGKGPREARPGGAKVIMGVQGTEVRSPRAPFQWASVKVVPAHRLNFRKLSRLPDSGRPAQRTSGCAYRKTVRFSCTAYVALWPFGDIARFKLTSAFGGRAVMQRPSLP